MADLTIVSFNEDGTYRIVGVSSMNDADSWATRHKHQTHYLHFDNKDWVVKWLGPDPDRPSWIATNEEQAKLALLLLLLDN